MKIFLKRSLALVAAVVLAVSLYFILGVLSFANRQYQDINLGNLEEAVRTLKGFTSPDVFTDRDANAEWVARLMHSSIYNRITLINRSGSKTNAFLHI